MPLKSVSGYVSAPSAGAIAPPATTAITTRSADIRDHIVRDLLVERRAQSYSQRRSGTEQTVRWEGRVAAMITRPIPSSGETLPVLGLGTWRSFDVGADAARR